MRVCIKDYPKGHDHRQRKDGFFLDNNLKAQLDVLLKNIDNDWDFTIIISGGGGVRVGKSVLAMQIAGYWDSEIKRLYRKKTKFTLEDNFIFDGRELIKKGNALGIKYPNSVLIFDEAGADLEGRKAMQSLTQDVMDFYRECGQYNLLNILVLPDFFELPKGIALSRAICLIDVYFSVDDEGKFNRGFFKFYSKRNKKHLYLKGKKDLNYGAHVYDFIGKFMPFYTLNEKKYREFKQLALIRRENKRKNKYQNQRDAAWYLLASEFGMTQSQIGQRMEQLSGIYTPQQTISDGLAHFAMENA